MPSGSQADLSKSRRALIWTDDGQPDLGHDSIFGVIRVIACEVDHKIQPLQETKAIPHPFF